LQYQPESNLMADDSRLIRIYGLEPEIVPQLRHLRSKVGFNNEGGLLALLSKDKLGAHLLRRTWARLSLWKLAMKSGYGGWMRWVLDAKQLDKLLAGVVQPDASSVENLESNVEEPVARWLLARLAGGKAAKQAGEPWLHDNITLLAFRVFDEDVRVEIARRAAETSWLDKGAELIKVTSPSIMGIAPGLRGAGGMRSSAANQDVHGMEKAWADGELVLLQPDPGKALHSGKALSLRHGCLRMEWSEYLARMHALSGPDATGFLDQLFLPKVLEIIEAQEQIYLDECSSSGCLLRGSVLALTEAGIALRSALQQLYWKLSGQQEGQANRPPLSICMDMSGEWTFTECEHATLGLQRIAFSRAVPQVDAGVSRDSNIERLIQARDSKQGLKSMGGVNVELLPVADGQKLQLLHNRGFAVTHSAMLELTRILANKATIRGLRPDKGGVAGLLDGYRMPPGGLDLLVIQRYGAEESRPPWVLMKVGKPSLAGVDVELFELLDETHPATEQIIERGLKLWH